MRSWPFAQNCLANEGREDDSHNPGDEERHRDDGEERRGALADGALCEATGVKPIAVISVPVSIGKAVERYRWFSRPYSSPWIFLGLTCSGFRLALIIALGLLVDDAMITVETMITRLERGWD